MVWLLILIWCESWIAKLDKKISTKSTYLSRIVIKISADINASMEIS